MNGNLTIAGDLLAISFLVPLIVFVVLYLTRSNWGSTKLGIILLLQKIGFSLILALGLVTMLIPDWPGRSILRIVVYSMVMALLWADVFMLLKYQNDPTELKTPTRHWWNRKNSL